MLLLSDNEWLVIDNGWVDGSQNIGFQILTMIDDWPLVFTD
jgi:hypothetical protein